MWEKHKDTIQILIWIIVIAGGCFYLYKTDDKPKSEEVYYYNNIRKFNGIDTVWSKDSAYILHFTIDSVYYDPDSTEYYDERGDD